MTENRLIVRAMCDRSKHTVARVAISDEGYLVTLDVVVFTGYGNRFDTTRETHRLDGPIDDPEAWFTYGACECGHQFVVDSMTLRTAIDQRQHVITLSPYSPPTP